LKKDIEVIDLDSLYKVVIENQFERESSKIHAKYVQQYEIRKEKRQQYELIKNAKNKTTATQIL
jgi:hypothetical protein